jgi:hypothetical protein
VVKCLWGAALSVRFGSDTVKRGTNGLGTAQRPKGIGGGYIYRSKFGVYTKTVKRTVYIYRVFAKIKNSVAYVKGIVDQALHQPDVNSRLVFLVNSLVCHVIALWQTFNYLRTPPGQRDGNYVSILMVVLGAHGVNGLGRYLTKRVGESDDAKDDAKAQN